ncbi:hypothetical protein DASC09_048320 [Saccharomycopsis crataegensis]|uniref:Uncharacterized protein n=1 Tax=Saccharomycopsis crataegensis TaxID=43959 RepID=A0AAV5QSX1_9ASCO|nr:hypothetical protein DASC09_048320 [Saccharomycopsis crataegensis]
MFRFLLRAYEPAEPRTLAQDTFYSLHVTTETDFSRFEAVIDDVIKVHQYAEQEVPTEAAILNQMGHSSLMNHQRLFNMRKCSKR